MERTLQILIEQLLIAGEKADLYNPRDKIYIRNQYYRALQVNEVAPFEELIIPQNNLSIIQIIGLILDYLEDTIILDTLGVNKEQQECYLIDLMLPPPSYIEDAFKRLKDTSNIKDALDWYYQFSCNTDYIKVNAIKRNKSWVRNSPYGNLEITVNLSKPEKDPKEIAKLKSLPKTEFEYPSCLLCIDNEGFSGTLTKPARHTHRMLTLDINNQAWKFQFSPYAYYPEHSIIINEQHKPMLIDINTLHSFFDFVDHVPHYLIGSNSDIPIVGGSILNHDHFQAGNYIFPIEKSDVILNQTIDNVEVNYLYWPISTLRLIGTKQDLLKLGTKIINKWYQFSCPEIDIIASTNNTRHNAITPILRKIEKDKYQLYLLLRNNRTTDEHPDGIFHPHQELHHIKKENIGLIEAMGLAILPGRLDYELQEMDSLLRLNNLDQAKSNINISMQKHEKWLEELYAKYSNFNNDNNYELLQKEVGDRFCMVLEHSGVFKHNPQGNNALIAFLNTI